MSEVLSNSGEIRPFFVRLYGFLLLLFAIESFASTTTHYIDFGGTHGFTYSPNSLAVEIGDTIVWRGDFSQYPLAFVSTPPGAKPIGQVNSGTTFSYEVDVPGNYTYQDPIYGPIGMKGSFLAQVLPHGSLTNEGRDFYLGLITPSYNYVGSDGYKAYAVITTYYDNTVTISYFDANGNEGSAQVKQIPRRNS